VVHVPVPDQQGPQRRHAVPLAATFGVFLGGDEPLVLGKEPVLKSISLVGAAELAWQAVLDDPLGALTRG
jgi:hypothetical protein